MKPLEEITVSINATKLQSRLIWFMTVAGGFAIGFYCAAAYAAHEVTK